MLSLRVGNGCELGSAGDHNVSTRRPANALDRFPGHRTDPGALGSVINPFSFFFFGAQCDFSLLRAYKRALDITHCQRNSA